MPRPKKTEAQLEEKRHNILDAAYDILLKEGSEGLTSRAIADHIGVTHMTLFTYFPNQAAILQALSAREFAKMRPQQEIFERRAGMEDIQRVVEEMFRYYTDFARKSPNAYRLAWVMPEMGLESLDENRQRMRDTIGYLARIIKIGMTQGCFTVRDPFLAAATVLGMVNMPYILFHSGKIKDPEMRDRMAEEVIGAAMGYLKTNNAKAS
jgi:AcrR family transcriptional regulator